MIWEPQLYGILTPGIPPSICAANRIQTLHLADRKAVLLLPSLTVMDCSQVDWPYKLVSLKANTDLWVFGVDPA